MRSGILSLMLCFVVLAALPAAAAPDQKTTPTPTPTMIIETWQLPFIYYEGENSDVIIVEYEWLDVSQVEYLQVEIIDSATWLTWITLDRVKAARTIRIPLDGVPAGKYVLITSGMSIHGQRLTISAVEFVHRPRVPAPQQTLQAVVEASKTADAIASLTRPPTATATYTASFTPTLTLISTPMPTPPEPGTKHILWIADCDPRLDPDFCKQSRSLRIFDQFYGVLDDLGATLTYKIPASEADLKGQSVIIANFCGPLSQQPTVTDMLRSYIASGGSVVVMGDNFCYDRRSSAESANALTEDFGIVFTGDDDTRFPWADRIYVHPITADVRKIYAFRHTYLGIRPPSQPVVTINNRPFIAVYEGKGTIVAIPDTGFHWGNDFQEVASSDNFMLWRNMLTWLIQRSSRR